ncbi:hypothetical protein WMF38_16910 [Sorangium sp. So ce118]
MVLEHVLHGSRAVDEEHLAGDHVEADDVSALPGGLDQSFERVAKERHEAPEHAPAPSFGRRARDGRVRLREGDRRVTPR